MPNMLRFLFIVFRGVLIIAESFCVRYSRWDAKFEGNFNDLGFVGSQGKWPFITIKSNASSYNARILSKSRKCLEFGEKNGYSFFERRINFSNGLSGVSSARTADENPNYDPKNERNDSDAVLPPIDFFSATKFSLKRLCEEISFPHNLMEPYLNSLICSEHFNDPTNFLKRDYKFSGDPNDINTYGNGNLQKQSFYCMPPPNVTGNLHLGHALSGVIQDIFVRFNRQRGCNMLNGDMGSHKRVECSIFSPDKNLHDPEGKSFKKTFRQHLHFNGPYWVPGADHAGWGLQKIVMRHLLRRKKYKQLEYLDTVNGCEFMERFIKIWNSGMGISEENNHKIIKEVAPITSDVFNNELSLEICYLLKKWINICRQAQRGTQEALGFSCWWKGNRGFLHRRLGPVYALSDTGATRCSSLVDVDNGQNRNDKIIKNSDNSKPEAVAVQNKIKQRTMNKLNSILYMFATEKYRTNFSSFMEQQKITWAHIIARRSLNLPVFLDIPLVDDENIKYSQNTQKRIRSLLIALPTLSHLWGVSAIFVDNKNIWESLVSKSARLRLLGCRVPVVFTEAEEGSSFKSAAEKILDDFKNLKCGFCSGGIKMNHQETSHQLKQCKICATRAKHISSCAAGVAGLFEEGDVISWIPEAMLQSLHSDSYKQLKGISPSTSKCCASNSVDGDTLKKKIISEHSANLAVALHFQEWTNANKQCMDLPSITDRENTFLKSNNHFINNSSYDNKLFFFGDTKSFPRHRCSLSGRPVELRARYQWYLDMTKLVKPAIRNISGISSNFSLDKSVDGAATSEKQPMQPDDKPYVLHGRFFNRTKEGERKNASQCVDMMHSEYSRGRDEAAMKNLRQDAVPFGSSDCAMKRRQEKNGLKIYPEKYRTTLLHYLKTAHEWCVSRQGWWGLPVPAFVLKPTTNTGISLLSRVYKRFCLCNGKILVQGDLKRMILQDRKQVLSQFKADTIGNTDISAASLDELFKLLYISSEALKNPLSTVNEAIKKLSDFKTESCWVRENLKNALETKHLYNMTLPIIAPNILVAEEMAKEMIEGLYEGTQTTNVRQYDKRFINSLSNENKTLEFHKHFKIEKDPDVFDTWFLSALWPLCSLTNVEKVIKNIDNGGRKYGHKYKDVGGITLQNASEMKNSEQHKFHGKDVKPFSTKLENNSEILDERKAEYIEKDTDLLCRRFEVERNKDDFIDQRLCPMNITVPECYPFELVATGHDILFPWIARQISLCTELTGSPPFKNIIVHSLLTDLFGKKLSKSKGNAPIGQLKQFINFYGADTVRFALIESVPSLAKFSSFGENHIKHAYGFLRKIWNFGRFLMNYSRRNNGHRLIGLDISPPSPETLAQKALLSRVHSFVRNITKCIICGKLSSAASLLRNFGVYELCNTGASCAIAEEHSHGKQWSVIMNYAFIILLRTLHPFAPFQSTALNLSLLGLNEENMMVDINSVVNPSWPAEGYQSPMAEATMGIIEDICSSIRGYRGKVKSNRLINQKRSNDSCDVDIKLTVESSDLFAALQNNLSLISSLSNVLESCFRISITETPINVTFDDDKSGIFVGRHCLGNTHLYESNCCQSSFIVRSHSASKELSYDENFRNGNYIQAHFSRTKNNTEQIENAYPFIVHLQIKPKVYGGHDLTSTVDKKNNWKLNLGTNTSTDGDDKLLPMEHLRQIRSIRRKIEHIDRRTMGQDYLNRAPLEVILRLKKRRSDLMKLLEKVK